MLIGRFAFGSGKGQLHADQRDARLQFSGEWAPLRTLIATGGRTTR